MAQVDKSVFQNRYSNAGSGLFKTNASNDIGSDDLRDLIQYLVDSALFISDNFIDEDSFASDSATKSPSQQSVKAYVNSQVGVGSIDLYSRIFEDFFAGPAGFVNLSTFTNGGGAGVVNTSTFGVDNTEKCSGVLQLTTSTSTAGGAALSNTTYQLTFGFGFQYTLSFRCALETLSDGTDTYTIRIGFLDNHAGAPVDGAYFRYTHGTNSGKWQAVTVSNSVETAEDTGITADITTFHIFKIVANSAASQIDFYIDGVKTNDITTNIINSASRLAGQVATIEKTAGATARALYVDYYELISERTAAR